jgi:hypothetical protein
VAERRFIAHRLSAALFQCADKLMYDAKGQRANHLHLLRVRIDKGQLAEMSEADQPTAHTGAGRPRQGREQDRSRAK